MTGIILALLLILAPGAGAQEAAPAPSPTAESLVESTLGRDVQTASYYELVAWCSQLGLDDSGTRRELQERLAQRLRVTLPPEAQPPKKTIEVKSARESEYFTLAEAEEKYVILRGEVLLEIRDAANGSAEQIRAQTLTYNQTRNTVTAEGDVTYTLTSKGKTDTFRGKSLAFDIDTSEGVFYDGSTERPVNKGQGDLTYHFRGATMSRLEGDIVILQEGSFTTCDVPDPHYQVRAQKAWILTPGEWAVQNAVLMMGRVPIFYTPAFFWPGDEIVFNPSPGFRNREGTFLQTTTYLMGKKKAQDNTFSLLQMTDTGGGDYTPQLHGIFLHKAPASGTAPAPGGTLKLLVDAYSRLGVFAGLTGDFPPLTTFRAGIGISRSVFFDAVSGSYTPYWTQPDGTVSSYWNTSSVLGLSVPFRFGVEGDVKGSGDAWSASARFEYFSDPSFTSDFYSRTEGVNLGDVLGAKSPTPAAPKQNLSWDIASRLDLTRLVSLPFLQSFTFPYVNLKFAWQSRDAPFPPGTPDASDPGRTFYFPSSITSPNAALTLSGDILKLTSAAASQSAKPEAQPAAPKEGTETPKDPGKGFRGPQVTSAERIAPEPQPRIPFRAPSPKPAIPAAGREPESSLAISYQVQPRTTLEHTFDSAGWARRENVDYRILYRTFDAGGSGRLTATASLWDRAAEISESVSVDGNFRARFDPSASLAPSAWQSLLLRDYQQDRLEVRSAFQATVRPFASVAELSGSSLGWRLGVRVFKVSPVGTDPLNPVFAPAGPTWSADSVSDNSLQASLALKTTGITGSIALSAQLPPLTTTATARGDLSSGTLKGWLQGGVTQAATGPLFQPVVAGASAGFLSDATASEELQFDANTLALGRSTTQVRAGSFFGVFTAERVGAQQLFLPSTLRAGFETASDPMWFWFDRIRVDASVRSAWNLNLQKYTDTMLDVTFRLNLAIYKFLELSLSSVSYNSKTYRYFPGWPEAVGEQWVNPLLDLVQSYNFFSLADRYRSAFKIRTLSVKAVHHLHDWDLSFEYQGSPQLRTNASGGKQYEWTPTFSLQVQWVPVPEVKSSIRGDANGVTLRN